MYVVRGEGTSSEAEEFVMHFIVPCDDEASVAAAQSVTYGEGYGAAITFFLEVRGGYVITCTQKL